MFILKIDFDQHSDAQELADLIDRVADDIRLGMVFGYVRDTDGDSAGHYELSGD